MLVLTFDYSYKKLTSLPFPSPHCNMSILILMVKFTISVIILKYPKTTNILLYYICKYIVSYSYAQLFLNLMNIA